ncbi:sensor histidine kinase [Spirosoma horti]
MNRKLLVTALLHLLLSGRSLFLLHAQPPNVVFSRLLDKGEFPSQTVYSIARDRQGFIWFGTRRCPVRYDGQSVRSFLFPETYLINGMAADSANRMWVASDRRGICRIDPHTLRLTSISKTPRTTGHFYKSSTGDGWFSTVNGVGRINLRTHHVDLYSFRQTTYQGLKAKGFLEDKQHRLWVIGSDNGVFRFDSRANRFVCVLGIDCPDPKRSLQLYLSRGCVDANGILWIGAYGHGLLRIDPDTEQFSFFKLPHEPNRITCVEEGQDESGKRILWVGDENGLLVFRPEQHQFFRLTNIQSAPFQTNVLYRDPYSGILWVGTSTGVFSYNPQDNLIRTIALPPSLVRQPVVVKVIATDQQDTTGQTFWLGLSHTGILRWHRPTNRFTLIRFPHGESEAMWFQQTNTAQLWIGLRNWGYKGDGVIVYDTRLNRFVETLAGKRAGTLFSVPFVDHGLIDRQQRLWVGNNDEGLQVVDMRTGKPLVYWSDSIRAALHRNNNFLTGLAIDATGRIWLSTYRGLYYVTEPNHRFVWVDGGQPATKRPDDLATNAVLVAKNGHVWAARWGSVTESLPNGRLTTILTARDGLYDRENRQLAEDKEGTIWIGNFDGLHSYNPKTRRFLRLTANDGLSQNTITAALYVHRGTELFIGQQNGIDQFDVTQLHRRTTLPPVVVTSFRVHEQERPFDPTRPIRLSRTENAFSVDFTTLRYSRLANTRYAYFLEGLDERWNYSGSLHRAYYTNLDPGRYTLHLKAADSFGNWSHKPLLLSIEILPAYYETWWFRTLLLLLVASLLYALYRYRINQLMRVLHIRNRISADLHDEIGSSLSGIGILGTMIKQNLPAEHPSGSMVERIVSEARHVSNSLDDIVWSINPNNDELSNLIARMNRYAAELFEASGITYQISVPDTIQHLTLSMEKRQDLYLISKEAVNNLVKHAQATQASLKISLEHQRLYLEVCDNGVGFDPNAETERNGVRNMQTRAKNLHGELAITSAPGQGTSLKLSFPVMF